jgi:ABC-2 type transport system permease protein
MTALGALVRGPTALGDDPARFARLTWTLAVTQFKLKFYGSALGYIWQLMRPLLLFGVLYVVFSVALNFGEGLEYFEVMLLLGVVLYTFVSEALGSAVNSIVERENLVRKVEFPRMSIPAAAVLTAIFNLGLNLVVVVIFAIVSGVPLHPGMLLQAPLLLLVLIAFVLGLSLLVSALFVRYRDLKPMTDVFLQVLFYATPILYPLETLPESAREWFMLNPFAVVVQQMRHVAIDPSATSPFDLGAGPQLAVAGAIVVVVCVVGYRVFRRMAPRMAEEL